MRETPAWRGAALTILLAVLLGACTAGEQSGASSPPTIPAPVTTGTGERPIRTVGCDPPEEEVQIVCEAYDLIRSRYVDPVTDEALADAAVRGLRDLAGAAGNEALVCPVPSPAFQEVCTVAGEEADDGAEAAEAMVTGMAAYALDPNSVYLDSQALGLIEEEQGGQIEGIGALVTAEDASSGEPEQCSVISDTCRMVIVSTFEASPARAADLREGDVIVGVNGTDITGSTVDEVTAMVRGPAGTQVRLRVQRGGEVFEVDITRQAVEVPVVIGRSVDDTAYVALTLFTENADEQLAAQLETLLGTGASTVVLDLRNDPGGLLDTAVEVASMFLPDGLVVVTQAPDSKIEYRVSGDITVPTDVEVVLLVNRGSASASEVVAAVLQERGRAVVVGENTFGKNTVQQRYRLSNGGALKLTIARWVTPGGLDFGGAGITPVVELAFESDETVETVVERTLAAVGAG